MLLSSFWHKLFFFPFLLFLNMLNCVWYYQHCWEPNLIFLTEFFSITLYFVIYYMSFFVLIPYLTDWADLLPFLIMIRSERHNHLLFWLKGTFLSSHLSHFSLLKSVNYLFIFFFKTRDQAQYTYHFPQWPLNFYMLGSDIRISYQAPPPDTHTHTHTDTLQHHTNTPSQIDFSILNLYMYSSLILPSSTWIF